MNEEQKMKLDVLIRDAYETVNSADAGYSEGIIGNCCWRTIGVKGTIRRDAGQLQLTHADTFVGWDTSVTMVVNLSKLDFQDRPFEQIAKIITIAVSAYAVPR